MGAVAEAVALEFPFVLDQPYVYVRADYECAAWWEEHTTEAGEFVAKFVPRKETHMERAACLVVEVPAKVTNDYFGALWCGVSVSKEPYKPKHVGEARTVKLVFPIDQFVYDARFKLTEQNYTVLCEMARKELAKDYTWYNEWVGRASVDEDVEASDRHGKWSTYKTALKFLMETMEQIDLVSTFKAWHDNYFHRPGYQGYTWGHYKPQRYSNR